MNASIVELRLESWCPCANIGQRSAMKAVTRLMGGISGFIAAPGGSCGAHR